MNVKQAQGCSTKQSWNGHGLKCLWQIHNRYVLQELNIGLYWIIAINYVLWQAWCNTPAILKSHIMVILWQFRQTVSLQSPIAQWNGRGEGSDIRFCSKFFCAFKLLSRTRNSLTKSVKESHLVPTYFGNITLDNIFTLYSVPTKNVQSSHKFIKQNLISLLKTWVSPVKGLQYWNQIYIHKIQYIVKISFNILKCPINNS